MPAKPILLLGNPLLWQPSVEAIVGTRETSELIADLGATLADFREHKGFGRAIAAPQIGQHKRVIFMNVGEPVVLINPVVESRSPEEMELWDDCFSFPDLMVRVRRHAEIAVRYTDERGAARTLTARNQLAELLQHELDHLDGILATDRAVDKRAFALRSEALRRS
jgi:peptide deformylase